MKITQIRNGCIALSLLAAAIPAHAAQSITFYHWDALGSPVVATDEQGNVKWREEYLPYGEKIQNQPQAQTNTRWYTGHPHDNATGLTYMGARWYDPVVGRFMAVDPKSLNEDNLHSFNSYAYANNNPYGFIDPDGRSARKFLLEKISAWTTRNRELLEHIIKEGIVHKLTHDSMEKAQHERQEKLREAYWELERTDNSRDIRWRNGLLCQEHGGTNCWNGIDEDRARLSRQREQLEERIRKLGGEPWTSEDRHDRQRFRQTPPLEDRLRTLDTDRSH